MPTDTIDYNKNSSLEFKTEIEVDYTHNLKELYTRMHVWLENNGFSDFNGMDSFETLYWQRDLPSGLTEHQIWWRAVNKPGKEDKQHAFFTWVLKINFQTIAVSPAEIMHQGRKYKMHKSNTILRIEGHQIWDWEKDFAKNGMLKGMQNRFKKWMYKDRVKHFEDELVAKCLELTDLIKYFMRTRAQTGHPEDIFPADALPR